MNDLKNYRVITAIITPMQSNGMLDFASLDHLVHLQEQAGNAILILGSTGEGLALSLAEKQAVVAHVFALKPQVPVIVGVGGFQLEEQMAWMKHCQEHYSLAGFLLVTPLYAKPGIKGQIAWFSALMDIATVPCIPYNIPGRSAVKLYPQVMEALAKHPNLGGLKEASGHLEEFAEFGRIIAPLPLYSGNDELLAGQMARGGFGVISVVSNVWPKQTKAYVDLCVAGRNTPSLDALWEAASQALFLVSNPIPLKVLMQREGLIASPTLRPPLTHSELNSDQIQKIVTLSQQIQECKELAQ